jgi:hypothetical protein
MEGRFVMLSGDSMERRLQFAGILMLLGLLVEAFFLFWTRPIGFVLFLGIGGLLLTLGVFDVSACSAFAASSGTVVHFLPLDSGS